MLKAALATYYLQLCMGGGECCACDGCHGRLEVLCSLLLSWVLIVLVMALCVVVIADHPGSRQVLENVSLPGLWINHFSR